MPIMVKLDDVLYARRMTLTELSERIGITLANLSILKTGKARAVRFSTLEAICEALECQPGDLLEFVPGLVATQHSGSGKANQYFLRGFNLDHGTDFATFVDSMPECSWWVKRPSLLRHPFNPSPSSLLQ